MSVAQVESPRRGGREARRALRAAPLAMNERPVWPGMTGGNFKPLSDADQQRIHQAAPGLDDRTLEIEAQESAVDELEAKLSELTAHLTDNSAGQPADAEPLLQQA